MKTKKKCKMDRVLCCVNGPHKKYPCRTMCYIVLLSYFPNSNIVDLFFLDRRLRRLRGLEINLKGAVIKFFAVDATGLPTLFVFAERTPKLELTNRVRLAITNAWNYQQYYTQPANDSFIEPGVATKWMLHARTTAASRSPVRRRPREAIVQGSGNSPDLAGYLCLKSLGI